MPRHRGTVGGAGSRPQGARAPRGDARRLGGEFGRTPFGQGDPASPKGRDHFGRAYSWWLAGGGIRGGHVHGATDDFAWNITADPVHVHDMQATMLHLLGIDHTRLVSRYQGRQFRLTDVHGHVVRGILA